MPNNRSVYTSFSPADMQAFEPALKIGILGTVRDDGLPHLTLISTLGASSPTQVVWGQFTEGSCKHFVRQNPKTGFLIMTLDKQLWRGKADFTHTATAGPDYERYNQTPMFRYNAYFGVHTVYYMNLVEHYGRQPLPMNRVILAAVQTMLARALFGRRASRPALNHWTRQLMNQLSALKFLGYIGADGYPTIIPVIQAQAPDAEHVLFALSAFGDELRAIPAGAPAAVLGLALSMEDVLLRGVFLGCRRIAGVRCGVVSVDWVYNPMPPTPQQIYPAVALEPVTDF